MGDLLPRGIDDALKAQLQENTRLNGRSLSDEAIDQLRKSLASGDLTGDTTGKRLRANLGDERLEEAEIAAIAAYRHQPDRAPPRFE
ncbi:plasmid stabilization protein [Rhizobium sp. 2YAF20]